MEKVRGVNNAKVETSKKEEKNALSFEKEVTKNAGSERGKK